MASAERVASSLLALLCLALSLVAAWGKTLENGEIAFKVVRFPTELHKAIVTVTDGISALNATVSIGKGILKCKAVTSTQAVDSILNDPDALFRNIGEKEIERMWQRCEEAEVSVRAAQARRAALRPETRSTFGIMPGTNWCGVGNIAENYDDLGEREATDMCCRTHDHCPYFIPGWTTKYHTFNTMPWTCSHCDCDQEFYQCLKKVNNEFSAKVGGTFFGTLKVKCFTFAEEKICVEYHYSGLWCNRYGTDKVAKIESFPHKW